MELMCFSCPTTDMQQDVKAELFLTLSWQKTQDNICQLFHALELDHLVSYEKKLQGIEEKTHISTFRLQVTTHSTSTGAKWLF